MKIQGISIEILSRFFSKKKSEKLGSKVYNIPYRCIGKNDDGDWEYRKVVNVKGGNYLSEIEIIHHLKKMIDSDITPFLRVNEDTFLPIKEKEITKSIGKLIKHNF